MKRIKELKNVLLLTAIYVILLIIFQLLGLNCIFKHFLHIPCPGCGMSRAIYSALRLDFTAAFSYHPMFWSIPVLYLYLLFGGKLFNKKWIDLPVLIIIGIGFLINWIVNLW